MSFTGRFYLSAAALSAGLAMSGTTGAQAADVDAPAPPVAVNEQLRPGYDQVGIRSGSFLFLPSLLSTVTFDDNVYATRSKTSDVVFRQSPMVQFKSDWSRHSLEGEFGVEGVEYVRQSKLNHINARIGAVGKFELGSSSNVVIESRFVRSADTLPQTGLASPDGPITVNTWTDGATFNHRQNRWVMSAAASWTYNLYENAKSFGVPVDQSFRNGYILNFTDRIGYEVSPSTVVFFQPGYNLRRYQNRSFNSEGYKLYGGFSTELTRLIVGEAYGGYLFQDFDNPTVPSLSTYGFGARLRWFATPLTVSASANRDVGDPSSTGAAPPVSNSFSLQTDYSIYHNMIWSTSGSYSVSKHTSPSYYEYSYMASTGLTYMFNRSLQGTMSFQRQWKENATLALNNNNRNQIVFGLKGQF